MKDERHEKPEQENEGDDEQRQTERCNKCVYVHATNQAVLSGTVEDLAKM